MKVCKTCGETLHNPTHPLSSRCDYCIEGMKRNTGNIRNRHKITVFHGNFSGRTESPSQRNGSGNRPMPAFRSFHKLFGEEGA